MTGAHNSVYSPMAYRDLISGSRRGWAAALARGLLQLAEVPYRWAVNHRNRRFDRGQAAIMRVPVPVISVGNITAGGTGKTPLVAWLAGWLQGRGLDVVLISRGYKSTARRPNDEALEMIDDLKRLAKQGRWSVEEMIIRSWDEKPRASQVSDAE